MKKKTIIIMASVIFVLLLTIVILLVTGGKKEITITFDTNGGEEISSIKIKKGSKTTLPTPIKEENVFDGWYISNNKVDENYEFNEDTTLKARWKDGNEKDVFTVTFDSQGGNEIEPVEVKCGEGLKLPEDPIKEGYTFIAWEDEDLKTIHDNDKLSCVDITLTANWDKENDLEDSSKMTIKFDSKGGSEVKSIRMYCKDTVPELPVPTKEGYIFVAWKSKSGKTIKKGDTLSCDRITVYASWKEDPNAPKYYTVTFDSKGGSTVEAIKVECGKELKLPSSPTKEGYEFVAWVDQNDKAILDGALLTCENIKLTADWKEKEESKPNYKCTEGTLNGDKCIIEKDSEGKCPDGYGYSEKIAKCYKYTSNAEKTCKDGGYFVSGHGTADDKCGYEEVTRLTGNVSGCSNEVNGTMLDNHCFKRVGADFNYSCPSNTTYHTASTLGGTQNSGCYTIVDKTFNCESGYELKNNKCIKTTNAIVE